MSNVPTKKTFIQIESLAEQQDQLNKQRKTLKVRQTTDIDKENLGSVSVSQADKLNRLKLATDVTLATSEYPKRLKVETATTGTQTATIIPYESDSTACKITVADLTGDGPPSSQYWERLAAQRHNALQETIQENLKLTELVQGLESELHMSRQQLEQARHLVDVLKDIIKEDTQESISSDIENSEEEIRDEEEEEDASIKDNESLMHSLVDSKRYDEKDKAGGSTQPETTKNNSDDKASSVSTAHNLIDYGVDESNESYTSTECTPLK